mmetsp:Transcript_37454/g.96749  ORF Transcript_37454/g.96749 Transcript_37454/m.96749 type:complete len:333 (-) Transcript_37454:2349-3347(-)
MAAKLQKRPAPAAVHPSSPTLSTAVRSILRTLTTFPPTPARENSCGPSTTLAACTYTFIVVPLAHCGGDITSILSTLLITSMPLTTSSPSTTFDVNTLCITPSHVCTKRSRLLTSAKKLEGGEGASVQASTYLSRGGGVEGDSYSITATSSWSRLRRSIMLVSSVPATFVLEVVRPEIAMDASGRAVSRRRAPTHCKSTRPKPPSTFNGDALSLTGVNEDPPKSIYLIGDADSTSMAFTNAADGWVMPTPTRSACLSTATAPAAVGVAMEVPDRESMASDDCISHPGEAFAPVEEPSDLDEITLSPTATMSGLVRPSGAGPDEEKEAIVCGW